MGLLKQILFWPVTGPMSLIDFSIRQVEGVVHHELTDDQRVKEDLMQLQMQLELEEITPAEYDRAEAVVLARLREVREWRQKLGMEEEWVPLEFPPAEPEGSDEAWSQDSSKDSDPDSSSS